MAGEHQHQRGPELAPETPFREITQEFPRNRPESIVFSTERMALITGLSHPQLARDIADEFNKLVDPSEPIILGETVTVFGDGTERKVKIPTNLRNRHVFILQSTCPPDVNAAVIETALMGDAAKRASARERTAVIPYFGYARGDRKDEPRVAIAAAVVADIIGERVERIVTMDLHAEQEQGFIKGPWDNLSALPALLPVLKEQLPPDIVVVSPDAGGVRRAEKFAEKLGDLSVVSIYKRRDPRVKNHAEALGIMGDVKDKPVLLVDDMIDTFGSVEEAATLLKKNGATRIFVAATHGLFSKNTDPNKDAIHRLNRSLVEKVFVTDTIPHRQEVRTNPKIQIVSTAEIFAKAIRYIETGESISENLLS